MLPFVALFIGVVLVVRVASHAARTPTTTPPPLGTRSFELDRGMPDAVVQRVLSALVHGEDPRQLEALAHELEARFPISARELRTKAQALRAQAPSKTSTTTASLTGAHAAPLAASHLPPRGKTAHEATAAQAAAAAQESAIVLQAVAKAMAEETDPVSLEGFGESIRAQYPTAADALVLRAKQIRDADAAAATQTPATTSGTSSPASPLPGAAPGVSAPAAAAPAALAPAAPPPAVAVSSAPPPPLVLPTAAPTAAAPSGAPAPTSPLPSPPAPGLGVAVTSATPTASHYTVRQGDTPTTIAERLVHNGARWPELVAANPTKPKAANGNFVSLKPGEALTLPPSWAAEGATPDTSAPQAHAPRVSFPVRHEEVHS